MPVRRWASLRHLSAKIRDLDRQIVVVLHRYGHLLHRVSLAALFGWFGLLKPFGQKTTTSLLAHTIYWGEPEVMVALLGWWEVA